MRDEYDFSNAKKNPYASKLKKQVTIRIDESAIDYFKNLAEETGISYQNLVNLYLVDCAKNKRKLEISFS
jgi:predicted DNA binding CopG/RHH family protein